MSIKELPKVELHVHLDGSLRKETIKEFLHDKNIKDEDITVPPTCHNLNEYLTKFTLPIECMQTKENLTRVARELAEDLEKDGVIYAEVRFAPLNHMRKGLSLTEIILAVLEGIKMVSGCKIRLLLSIMRGTSDTENRKVIEFAKKYLGQGVVGLDLAGAEEIYKTEDYQAMFLEAREKQIPFTIHAGEAAGPSSIKSAIAFGASRLGHGIRCTEDVALMDEIIEKGIVLEVCPTSNIQTKVVHTYETHPLKELYEAGVLVTVNTDNRTVSNITLTEEYARLQTYLHFSIHDFICMNKNAIKGAFLSEEEKILLLEHYDILVKKRVLVDEIH